MNVPLESCIKELQDQTETAVLAYLEAESHKSELIYLANQSWVHANSILRAHGSSPPKQLWHERYTDRIPFTLADGTIIKLQLIGTNGAIDVCEELNFPKITCMQTGPDDESAFPIFTLRPEKTMLSVLYPITSLTQMEIIESLISHIDEGCKQLV
jgi:hypothetical protein